MIEVLKQALDALETEVSIDWTNNDEFNASAEKMHDAIASLHQAIAELESQKPVAHQKWCASLTQLLLSMPPQPVPCNCRPPQRTWQGLTDEEQSFIYDQVKQIVNSKPFWVRFADAIEAKIKEKNSA
jgi:hypothetical protein